MRHAHSEGGGGEGEPVVVVFEETSTFSTALFFFIRSASSAGTLSLENIDPADLEMTAAPAAAQAIIPRTGGFFFLRGRGRG